MAIFSIYEEARYEIEATSEDEALQTFLAMTSEQRDACYMQVMDREVYAEEWHG